MIKTEITTDLNTAPIQYGVINFVSKHINFSMWTQITLTNKFKFGFEK